MTTIYLIRHSERINHDFIESINSTDTSLVRNEKDILSVRGEKRAKKLADLKELEMIDKVYASKLVRTFETAKYFLEKYNLKVNIDERLDERRVGKPNDNIYPDWFVRQFEDKDYKTEGGESQREVANRMNEIIGEILNNEKDKRIAIFSHGYAICFYLLQFAKLENIDFEKNITLKYKNNIILDRQLNAPEIFKLEFDNKELISIENITPKELRKWLNAKSWTYY